MTLRWLTGPLARFDVDSVKAKYSAQDRNSTMKLTTEKFPESLM